MDTIAVKTTIPIFILLGAGFLSRKTGILKSGDERVLSAYVYYFAMPALSLLNLAETEFTAETFRFMLAGILPVFGVLLLYLFLSAMSDIRGDKRCPILIRLFLRRDHNFFGRGILLLRFVKKDRRLGFLIKHNFNRLSPNCPKN
jgi:hypothetical protein